MPQPQLEGPAAPVDDPVRLKREIAGLERELADAKDEAATAKQSAADAVQAIRALRHQLEPLYKSLKMIFGEISRVEVGEMPTSAAPSTARDGRMNPAWERWKRELGGKAAEFIDALLEHGPMTVQQVVVTTRTSRKQTIYDVMHRLSKLNLVEKNGERYTLREQ